MKEQELAILNIFKESTYFWSDLNHLCVLDFSFVLSFLASRIEDW